MPAGLLQVGLAMVAAVLLWCFAVIAIGMGVEQEEKTGRELTGPPLVSWVLFGAGFVVLVGALIGAVAVLYRQLRGRAQP